MNPDGPTAVTVTLVGGPCDGQVVNVWPDRGGAMPFTFEALQPADQRTEPAPVPTDYHTYLRVNDGRERYMYAGEVLRHA
jgi:hypothetical protein